MQDIKEKYRTTLYKGLGNKPMLNRELREAIIREVVRFTISDVAKHEKSQTGLTWTLADSAAQAAICADRALYELEEGSDIEDLIGEHETKD